MDEEEEGKGRKEKHIFSPSFFPSSPSFSPLLSFPLLLSYSQVEDEESGPMCLNRVKERFKWSMISCGKKVTTSHRSQIALAAYRWLSMRRPKHGSRTEQRTTRRIQFPATLKRDERLRQRRSEPRVNTETPTIHVHPDGARVSVVCVCV